MEWNQLSLIDGMKFSRGRWAPPHNPQQSNKWSQPRKDKFHSLIHFIYLYLCFISLDLLVKRMWEYIITVFLLNFISYCSRILLALSIPIKRIGLGPGVWWMREERGWPLARKLKRFSIFSLSLRSLTFHSIKSKANFIPIAFVFSFLIPFHTSQTNSSVLRSNVGELN